LEEKVELEGLIKGLNKTRFPFNILGIILFGSYVKNRMGENGDSALFFLLKIGRCPHFPPMIKVIY